MPASDEAGPREKGMQIVAETLGPTMATSIAQTADAGAGFGPEQARWTLDFAYGEVWSRGGLERKLRSVAVIGMLIGQGHLEELKYHVRIGIANGLTRTELEEIFYTSIPYCGFPAANVAKAAMLDALGEAKT